MRIVVAMSGGVDSSVVAGLLKEAGHEVIGVTLQLYDHGVATKRRGACCAGEDIHDARRVADQLRIAHYVIDAEARFQEAVISQFAASYATGETPVPCIRCNQSVKFKDLSTLARGLGAERLATGHYVRRIEGNNGAELHRAVDLKRDQSWFLFATTRDQLDFAIFPLGEMADKAEVRSRATLLGLAVADKPDSQDICFVPSGSYADVVARMQPAAMLAGDIVDAAGRVVGRHDGIGRYTIGQSSRLADATILQGERQVVVATEPATRRIVVGPRASADHKTHNIRLSETNWLISVPNSATEMQVKLRAGEAPQPAMVTPTPWGARVCLAQATLSAPGQACVFYEGSRVLGGGFIRRSDWQPPALAPGGG